MRTILALLVVLAAALIGPAGAPAATIVVRGNATTASDSAWTSTPVGAQVHTVLGDPVVQPVAPSTSGDYLTAGTAAHGAYAGMSFPAPSLPAGVAPTSVTAWVYGQVGGAQALTVSLWSGFNMLGYSVFGAGQALGWHSFTLSPTPTAGQLAQLGIALRTDGTAGSPTTTKVYAAYVEIDAPDAAGPGSADTSTPAGPSAGGQPPSGADQPANGSPATGLGKVLQGDSPLSAPGLPVAIATPPTIDLPAAARAVPVDLFCPSGATGRCRGRAVLELLETAQGKRARARAARCARGCRVIGQSSFDIAAGKHKPIQIAMRPTALRLLPRGRSVRARLTVTSRDATHASTTSTRTLTIRRGAGQAASG